MNKLLLKQAEAILDDENILGALANITAFISEQFPTVSWAGFYFLKNDKLFLGPFQGKVACSILSLDKGVCAFSFNRKETVNVVPSCKTLCTEISPPCPSMMDFARGSPNPIPCVSREYLLR